MLEFLLLLSDLFYVSIYCHKLACTSVSQRICFHLFSRHLLSSLAISSLTHWLLKSVLYNPHILVNFPVFLLLLISSVFPLQGACYV